MNIEKNLGKSDLGESKEKNTIYKLS